MKPDDLLKKQNRKLVLLFVASYLIFRYLFANWHSIEIFVKNLMN